MDNIYINLSPKQKKEENIFLKNFFYYGGVGVFFLLAVIVILVIFIVIRASVYKYEDIKWSKWKDKYETISKIKKDLAALDGDRNEFKKILTPKNQMAKIFGDIFSSLPKNIWFNSMSMKKDTLDIRGYVVKIDEDYLVSLEKFINNLKAKKYFSSKFQKINIKDSQKNDFNGAEVLEFYVECAN
ncbi:MAG: PilN domain-containing protein [Candidatus Omnitrophica bacterium]|jgi:Tfp pilus assembly protein PilN|nr:PilN domain-containing protein [Candidatus Omnitrophota bacterium]